VGKFSALELTITTFFFDGMSIVALSDAE